MNRQHHDDEYGIWEIYGEDPNCDLGGYHHNPFLGRVEGRYKDALEYAKTLKGFYQWGSGGFLKKLDLSNVVKLDEEFMKKVEEKEKLEKEKRRLEERLREIDKELGNIRFD